MKLYRLCTVYFMTCMLLICSCNDTPTEPENIIPVAIAPAAGEGTDDHPYQISSIENLYWISQNTNVWNNHFIQTADIDASSTRNWISGVGWTPIGSCYADSPFTGDYDGNGKTIEGLYIKREYNSYNGLFGYTKGAAISNLGMVDVNIYGSSYTGSLIGKAEYNDDDFGSISNCYCTGSVQGFEAVGGLVGEGYYISDCFNESTVQGSEGVGGLVGVGYDVRNCYNAGYVKGSWAVGGVCAEGYIYESYNIGRVCGTNYTGGVAGIGQEVIDCYNSGAVSGEYRVGGLAGRGYEVQKSYNTGAVTGTSQVGGLLGFTSEVHGCYNTGSVTGTYYVGGLIAVGIAYNCYSMGSVTGSDIVGGIIGYGYAVHCYSTGLVNGLTNVGGLIGQSSTSEALPSYWNTETSGQPSSDGGEGRTTAQMTYPYAANTYVGWDFSETWAADTGNLVNNGYPYLKNNPLKQSLNESGNTPSHVSEGVL